MNKIVKLVHSVLQYYILKDSKCTNHITDWDDFHCFGFGENNRSAVKGPTSYNSLLTVPNNFPTFYN